MGLKLSDTKNKKDLKESDMVLDDVITSLF